jgi:transcriptional regulator with XRE-family HTH domain
VNAHDESGSEFLQAFGMRIKLLRTKRRMTQQQLGDAAGMHRTFIGFLERGVSGMNVALLPQLAAGLGVSLAEFFDDPELAQFQGRRDRVAQ